VIASPFDTLADGYDRDFTGTRIGRWMREAVWRRCDVLFAPGAHVLEINCGTGEDAVHLAHRGVRVTATDASAAMVVRARAKVEAAGCASLVDVRQCRIEDVGPALGQFDGVLSDFGGLNCVDDLPAAAARLASVVPAGGRALCCIMGPCVPWEWAWYLAHGDRRRAMRRLHPGGTTWRGVTIRYPSIRQARRAFAPGFRVTRVSALGAVLPPPFAERWVQAHARTAAWCERLERATETWWPLPWCADHFVMELERRWA
jgi:SAM-dependent methyltransferase